jgi:hypothetical protein
VLLVCSSFSRYILSAKFRACVYAGHVASGTDNDVDTSSPANSTELVTPRPLAVDIGAGCGLTTLALLACGYDVICTDKNAVTGILQENVDAFVSIICSESGKDSLGSVRAVEYDWFKESPALVADEFRHQSSAASLAKDLGSVAVDSNSRRFHPLTIDARTYPAGRNIDLILCSDCVYSTAAVIPLINIVKEVFHCTFEWYRQLISCGLVASSYNVVIVVIPAVYAGRRCC